MVVGVGIVVVFVEVVVVDVIFSLNSSILAWIVCLCLSMSDLINFKASICWLEHFSTVANFISPAKGSVQSRKKKVFIGPFDPQTPTAPCP